MKYGLVVILIAGFIGPAARSNDIGKSAIKQRQKIRVEIDTVITKHILFVIPYHKTTRINIIGDVSSGLADSIVLSNVNGKLMARRIAFKDIKRVWITEKKRRTTIDGMLIGAALGFWFSLPAIMGDREIDSTGFADFKERRQKGGNLFAEIVGGGAVIGGIIGWFHKVDKWDKIESEKFIPRVKLGLRGNRFQFMATLDF